jgi:hypothetical protein
MPRKITAYGCEFKCGHNVFTKRKRAAEHEVMCFHNPIRKACQSCAHFKTGHDTVYNPYHDGNPGSTDYESKYHYCEVREDADLEQQLHFDCPHWKNNDGK